LKCKVCSKEANEKSDYCELHAKAYENVVRRYYAWKKALDVSWKDYLNEILKNPLTGLWAKEVAQQLYAENVPILGRACVFSQKPNRKV
jgi:hypothetical protein